MVVRRPAPRGHAEAPVRGCVKSLARPHARDYRRQLPGFSISTARETAPGLYARSEQIPERTGVRGGRKNIGRSESFSQAKVFVGLQAPTIHLTIEHIGITIK